MRGDGKVYWRGKGEVGRHGGGSWWIRFSRHGHEVRLSAHTHVKTKALRMLRDEVNKSRSDAWIDPKARRVTIGELVADLEKNYRARRKDRFANDTMTRWRMHLQPVFEHVPAHALTTTMLNDYKAARFASEDKPAVATVNRELQVLRKAFKLAAEHEPPKVARVPRFTLDAEDNAVKEFFTADQLDKLREAASRESPDWRAIVEIAYALGWRRGEILGLRVGNFDLLAGTVRLETSKNGEPRECVITDRLKLFLQPLLVGRNPDERAFQVEEWDFRRGWPRIAKAAGVKKFHSFRRTSARNKRAAGVSESVVMREAGWRTASVFRRYAIVAREDRADSQRKLEEFELRTRTINAQNGSNHESQNDKIQ